MQIVRVFFQRKQDTPYWDGTTNVITDIADWQTAMSAVDETKIVGTPLIGNSPMIGNPTIEAGEAQVYGGNDNSTFLGRAIVTDIDPSSFSMELHNLAVDQASALKDLMCYNDLQAYLIVQGDLCIAATDDDGATYRGMNISSTFVGDRTIGGIGTVNMNMLTFQLDAGWDNNIETVQLTTGSFIYDL